MGDSDKGRASLAFGILGPFEATYDERRLPLGGRQQRAVLAVLVCEAGRAVSVDRLVTGVWGDPAPPGAVTSVQTHVFHLRQLLEPDRARGAPGAVLVTVPGGYRLDVDPSCVDMVRFERLAASGEEALAAADPAGAVAAYDAALALWRGDVLADLADPDFVAPVRAHLDEARTSALESRLQAELALGHHAAVVPEASALIRDHPLRERLHGQLIVALYRSGRQSDALEAYRDLRRVLDTELGIEPSPPLQELQRLVLTQDPSLDWQPPVPPRTQAPMSPAGTPAPPDGADGAERRTPGHPWSRIGALAAASVLAIAMLGGADLHTPPLATSTLPANTVAELDGAGRVLATIAVGTNPTGMAYGAGALWVVNASDDTVSRIDPVSHAVRETIEVGNDPRSVVVVGKDLWVTNFGDGTVSRVNVDVNHEVDTVEVGVGPDAIAAGPVGLWVANSGDNTIQRIDSDHGVAEPAFPVGDGPDGLAVDDKSVWVTNGREGSVMRIAPGTGALMLSEIRVGSGPRGIVRAGGHVWVADELSQSVHRIDVATGTSTSVPVGDGPTALAFHGGYVWVAERYAGDVVRIDPETLRRETVSARGAVHGLTIAAGRTWVAAGAEASPGHRGGTLVVAAGATPGADGTIDPARVYDRLEFHAESNVYDTLITWHDASSDLQVQVPDLATRVPEPADSGRAYVFTLRRGIRYSTGREVLASDIRRGVRRALWPTAARPDFYAGILGARACTDHPRRCDLSKGVDVDDATGRVTFHLRAPDPTFLDKLTMLVVPTPPGTPMGELQAPLPSTGPYRISQYAKNRVFVLDRNYYFRQWSAAAQPDGYVDRFVWLKVADAAAAARAVEQGQADLAELTPLGEDGRHIGALVDSLLVTDPGHLYSTPVQGTSFIVLNSAVPPFDHAAARRALAYAIDRRKVVELLGGPTVVHPTCQLLPPSMPSYKPFCPFTTGPVDGTYLGPDVGEAKRLVALSGTKQTKVRVTDVVGDYNPPLERYVARVLRQIGYVAMVHRLPRTDRNEAYYYDPGSDIQVETGGWFSDFPLPSNFLEIAQCATSPGYTINFCDAALNRRMAAATTMQQEDPAAALRAWTSIDHDVAELAPVVPVTNPVNWWLTGPKVGDYLSSVRSVGPLMSRLWVR